MTQPSEAKIQITNEMILAVTAAAQEAESGNEMQQMAEALKAVVAIIERDYAVDGGPIPASVAQIWDRDNDLWERLASGGWVCVRQRLRADSAQEIRATHGPVIW